QLVVAADGAHSQIRAAAGIAADVEDYDQVAVVANVATDRAHEGRAFERFTREGPLAVLPLHDGTWAVIWACRPARAARLLSLDEAAYLARLQAQFGWRAGRFVAASRRGSYPLRLTRAATTVGVRTVLIGNAAQALHPVAGQGFNLGLRDAALLAEVLANTAGDVGSAALSRASEHLLRSAGAWRSVAGPRLSAYERMRVWHESVAPDSEAVLVFDAADVGEPNLGYIVENRLLQGALLEAFTQAGGHLEPASLESLEITAAGVGVVTNRGRLATRLVVGADGASSRVRQAAGIAAEVAGYRQTAIIATVATARPHEATAWQRFMRDGTLAFLPLADGTSSIVWSADDELAARLVAASDDAFTAELDRASDRALGATRLRGARVSFPLQRLNAQHYVVPRVALTGDAAHVVHPLAGQGVNLGLADAAALAQL